jgi:outer membrane receptor for ferrienterochelin and colicin
MNKSSTFFRFSLLGYVGVAVLMSAGASAQTAAPAGGADGEVLDEVVVSGFRSSLEKSLEKKRAAVNFVDSISADDVGKLPDNNLAEAIARIPGVQISRTNGEGQQINLRGLGPSFTRVTLDGMPISVASEGSVDQAARNREFDFDLLPSDLFSSLEVAKSPQASLVEGGLAGTVNLRARTSLRLRRSRRELQARRRLPVEFRRSRPARHLAHQQNLERYVRNPGERRGIQAHVPYGWLELTGLDIRPVWVRR